MKICFKITAVLVLLGVVSCAACEPSLPPDNCSDATVLPPERYMCRFQACLEMLSEDKYDALALYYDADAIRDTRSDVIEIDVSSWIPVEPVQVAQGFPVYDVDFPIDWDVDPYSDRTWQHRFHSLYWLADFFDAADEGDLDALRTAWLIISEWIQSNSFWPGENTAYQWGDHTSSNRLGYLVKALQRYNASTFRDPLFKNRLMAAIAAHVYFLASDAQYAEQANHGIMSDLALLQNPMNVSGFKDAEEIFDWASFRIELQFEYAFTSDGVHKEHSPCYHLFVVSLLLTYRNILRDFTDQDYTHWSELLSSTGRFAAHIVQPSGLLPSFGDCHDGGEVVASQEYIDENPGLLYSITGGVEGTQPADPMAVFESAGWAIFRSSWDPPFSDIVYAAIQSDFFSWGHYHEDETSFIITAYGEPLIVDPGYNSYNWNPIDLYAKHALAHNVMIVDGREFESDVALVGSPGITRWLAGSVGSWRGIVELTHSHYADVGVQLSRQFAHLDDRSFLVKDIVSADGDHDYTQLFHLAPGSEFTDMGLGVYRFQWAEHDKTVWLRNTSADFEVIEGREEPLQGWVFPALLTAIPAQVLQLTLGAVQNAELTTLISVTQGSGSEPDWTALEARSDQATSQLSTVPPRDLNPR